MRELICCYRQILRNAKQFQADIAVSTDLQGLRSSFKHWYYFEEINFFAPSKFIGYISMNVEIYMQGHTQEMDGRDTEKVLKEFFVSIGEVEAGQKTALLKKQLDTFGKAPKKNAVIHVRNNVDLCLLDSEYLSRVISRIRK